MLGLFMFLFKVFMAVSVAVTSFMNPAVIVPNSAHLNFTADNIVFKNITYTAAMKSKFSAANETNTMNVTVENVKFRKFNSATDNWLMFESDDFANVTYK